MSLGTIYELNLDLKQNNFVSVRVRRADKNSRTLNIRVTDNGKEYVLTQGLKASLQVMKPDGNAVEQTCQINTDLNLITCTLNQNAISVCGVSDAELSLYNTQETTIISTMKFRLAVEDTVISKSLVQSTTEFESLTHLIQIGDGKVVELTTAINDAVSTNNNLKANENKRIDAENKRVQAETKRVNTEQARVQAETGRAQAETGRVQAETKRQTDTVKALKDINDTTAEVQRKLQAGEFVGDSAYEEAVKHGFKGTEQEWLASLRYDHSDEFGVLAGKVNKDAADAKASATQAASTANSIRDNLTQIQTNKTNIGEHERRIDLIETQGVAVGDTLPIGGTFFFEGNESQIPTGFAKVVESPVPPKPNLLINADFESSIINQLSYKTTIGQAKRQYPIDMWSTYGLIDVTNEIGYLTIKNNESSKQSFTQFLTNRLAHGKKYTITYKIDNTVESETFTSGSEFIGKNCFYKPQDSLPERIGIDVQGNKTIKLYFVKLEEGDVYTGKPPYDWWHEFSICQTELKQISTTLAGYGWNGSVYTLCPQIINMVRQPSIILKKGGLDGKVYISNDQSGTAEFLSYDASVSANGTIGALRWYNAGAWDGYKVCGYINTEKIWLDARKY